MAKVRERKSLARLSDMAPDIDGVVPLDDNIFPALFQDWSTVSYNGETLVILPISEWGEVAIFATASDADGYVNIGTAMFHVISDELEKIDVVRAFFGELWKLVS